MFDCYNQVAMPLTLLLTDYETSYALDESINIVPTNTPKSSSDCHCCNNLKRACCME